MICINSRIRSERCRVEEINSQKLHPLGFSDTRAYADF